VPRHVPVGRLAGVRIGLTPAVLLAVVALAVVAGLGAHVAAAYVATPGVVVLGSLLAHELAHGLVARAHGYQVDGVVLGLAGGVVAYSGEAPTPAVDVRIAVAGPFASGLLACALAAAHSLVPGAGPMSGLLLFGAWVNLANAAVNLLPLPSLDGGRVAAALLEQRRHRRRTRDLVAAAPFGGDTPVA
jgi:Zn-dependent protease